MIVTYILPLSVAKLLPPWIIGVIFTKVTWLCIMSAILLLYFYLLCLFCAHAALGFIYFEVLLGDLSVGILLAISLITVCWFGFSMSC
jgi:hypothetical protein